MRSGRPCLISGPAGPAPSARVMWTPPAVAGIGCAPLETSGDDDCFEGQLRPESRLRRKQAELRAMIAAKVSRLDVTWPSYVYYA